MDAVAVQLADVLRLAADVEGVGGVHLHAKRHLILGNARYGFGIAERGVVLLVQFIDRIQHVAPFRKRDIRRAIEVQHRLAVRAALHTLIHAGKETGAP